MRRPPFMPRVTSFRTKERLLIMCVSSFVMLASSLSFLVYSILSFNRESRTRLAGLGDIIAADVSAAVAFGDEAAVAKSLGALRADPAIQGLVIRDEQGRVLARYHAPGRTLAKDGPDPLRHASPDPLAQLGPQVERPITQDGVRLGTITLIQDRSLFIHKILAATGINLVIFLGSVVVSFLLADRFHRIITAPVTTLAEAMMDVSRTKDFTKRMEPFDTDEMNQLAEGFNRMLSEIAQRDDTLLDRQNTLHRMANYDPLTQLPNRALFMDRLEQVLPRASRAEHLVAVLFIDLDDFKLINDTHGHRTGDQLLQEVARRLAANTRNQDTLARLGGDEFVIFLQDIKSAENALTVACKHVEKLNLPVLIDDKRLFISASIGVAMYPQHGLNPEVLIKSADTAMYRAKQRGKNNTELFTQRLHEEVSERLNLCNDLRRALEYGELVLHYQPKVDLKGRKWAGVEALLRWQHPDLGLVSPDKFIPLAEQTGLILPIGEWVIREASRQILQWQAAGVHLPRISVNVSPLQIQRQNLPGILQDVIALHGLRPEALELEIVESAFMENLDQSIQVLGRIRELGVKISIDDFGTGYSSLGLLRNLPVDILKIDRSFVRRLHESEQDVQILVAILAMAKSLHLEVVAEGIECEDQARILMSHGCHEAQGYFYCRPLPPDLLIQRLLCGVTPADSIGAVIRPECPLMTEKPDPACSECEHPICLKVPNRT